MEKLLTVAEVVELSGCSRPTIRKEIESGNLVALELGHTKIRESEYLRWIAKKEEDYKNGIRKHRKAGNAC